MLLKSVWEPLKFLDLRCVLSLPLFADSRPDFFLRQIHNDDCFGRDDGIVPCFVRFLCRRSDPASFLMLERFPIFQGCIHTLCCSFRRSCSRIRTRIQLLVLLRYYSSNRDWCGCFGHQVRSSIFLLSDFSAQISHAFLGIVATGLTHRLLARQLLSPLSSSLFAPSISSA